MRVAWPRCAIGAMAALFVAATSPAFAQAPPAASGTDGRAGAPAAKGVTGKERLGDKWTDEQRVDNCKVPPDKRGATPRSDTCAPTLTH